MTVVTGFIIVATGFLIAVTGFMIVVAGFVIVVSVVVLAGYDLYSVVITVYFALRCSGHIFFKAILSSLPCCS